jgi:hypothetical protein
LRVLTEISTIAGTTVALGAGEGVRSSRPGSIDLQIALQARRI